MAETQSFQALELYLKELPENGVLSPAQEIILARQIKAGREQAFEALLSANLRFVVKIAKEYRGQGLPFEDLIAEGNLGLIKAAQRFDETRGFKFITYAVWWIRQAILQALAEKTREIRLPTNKVKQMRRVTREAARLEQELGRGLSMAELAENTSLDSTEIAELHHMKERPLSLHRRLREDGSPLHEVIEDPGAETPDEPFETASLKIELQRALSRLKPREAEVIRLSFGLERDRKLKLSEIGERLNISRERVRQIREHALSRLRLRRNGGGLREFLG